MLVKRKTIGTISNPRRHTQHVDIPPALIVLGPAAIAAYVGFTIGGPVGAAVGALIGTVVGAAAAFIASGKAEKLSLTLKPNGQVILVLSGA